MPLFTISIPTYNRNESLNRVLCALVGSGVAGADVDVKVFDNHSLEPVVDTIPLEIKKTLGSNLKITRNSTNVGLGGNLLRALEDTDQSWVWLLSDDDEPTISSIETISRWIRESNEKVSYVNFAPSGSTRTHEKRDLSFCEFIEACTPLWQYTLISSSVVNTDHIRRFFHFGYRSIFSLYPHFALTLLALATGSKAGIATESIVTLRDEATFSWDRIERELGVMTIIELPFSKDQKKALYSLFRASFPGPRSVASQLEKRKDLSKWEKQVYLSQFIQRRYGDNPVLASLYSTAFHLSLSVSGSR